MEQQPTMIALIGGPGSGKTTLGRNIIKHETYINRAVHISLGQEVRNIYEGQKSEVSQDIARHFNSVDRYALLPDDVIDTVAIEALRRYRTVPHDLMVIDGKPRTLDQMDDLLRNCAAFNYQFSGIIHTTIEPQKALARLIKRQRSSLEERLSEEDVQHRLDLYDTKSATLPDALRRRGVTVHTVWTGDKKANTLAHALDHINSMIIAPPPTHEAA
jgi:adenylate kinase family enzyme